MSSKNLIIIDNEKISKKNNNFYCDNFEARISEDLNKIFDVTLIARKSKIERARRISLDKVKIASNVFLHLLNIFKTFKTSNTRYLIIAINPYTFFSYLFLLLFRKKIFVYLRSSGHEEYKAILGFIGPAIYHAMFKIVTFKSIVITCQKRLFVEKKSNLVFPSELDSLWFNNKQIALTEKPRLLYVGRIKVEKGIFSFLKIFNAIEADMQFSVVGRIEDVNLNNKKINFLGHIDDPAKLVEIYDDHNIFVLPSFTEAHPKVIDESLARNRPVIIFEEIKHVIQNRKGIFVSKRNLKSFIETVNFIMKNYENIQENINKNKLPTKKEFISQMDNILSSN